MKTLFLKRLMFIFLLFVACYSSAQSLRSLPFQKRDSTLIRIAKETLKKKAPEYLIENGAPIISKHRVRYLTPAEEKEVRFMGPSQAKSIILSNFLKMNQ